MTGTAILREATWLTGARARAYALIVAALLAVCAAAVVKARWDAGRGDALGRPPATDFVPFYAAGRLANAGVPQQAYDLRSLGAEERRFAVVSGGDLPFMYPPPLLLLCAAVAKLPYGWASVAFELAGLLPLLFFLSRLRPAGWPMLPIALAPAVWMTFGSGQTGFLIAASFAAGAALLQARPLLAGAGLGFLVCKPHIALIVPVALFAARRWRAAAACAATALALCVLSLAVFGLPAWQAFVVQLPLAREVLEHWRQDWRILISIYGAVRVLGGGIGLAYVTQAAGAVAAVSMLAWVCFSRPGGAAEMALLCATSFVAIPYVMDYDLACLMVPALWLASRAMVRGWWPWEKLALAALYLVPLLARAVQLGLGIPLALPFVLVLFVLVLRRARAAA